MQITVKPSGRIYINGKKSNFYLQEFVTPEIYGRWDVNALRYVDSRRILIAQFIRDYTEQSVTICNWHAGGVYQDSGTRDVNSYKRLGRGQAGYINTFSAHKFAMADDYKIGDLTSYEMVDLVKDNWETLYDLGLRRVENPDATKGKHRGWLHGDLLETGVKKLTIVNP